MNYVKTSASIVHQGSSLEEMYKLIERCGRVCYHSESSITTDSYIKFLEHQLSAKHMSPLEHGTVYLIAPKVHPLLPFFQQNPFSRVVVNDDAAYITTNYRVIYEHNLVDFMEKYWSGPTTKHPVRITFCTITDIAGYKDVTRHRSLSPLIESTRFCNYAKDKFGNSIKFLEYPATRPEDLAEWTFDLTMIEQIYMKWLGKGYTAQDASMFLPQQTAATCYWSGFVDSWEHFLYLRYYECTGKVRPEVKELSTAIFEQLVSEYPDVEW